MKSVFSALLSRFVARDPAPQGLVRSRFTVQAAGFVAIGAIIAVLVALSLHSMDSTHDSLERLARHLQGKLSAISVMRENLYLRIVSTRNMLLMTDPFAIDEERQTFRIYASRIGVAYDNYLALVDDQTERELLEHFMHNARQGMPRLEAAIAQMIDGKRPAQILPMLQEAFTTQQRSLETLQVLQHRLEAQSVQLAQEAVDRYDRTRLRVLLLAALAGGLVLVIATVVSRDVVKHTRALEQEHIRYKALFDGSRDAVLILRDGAIVEWNPQALAWLDRAGRDSLAGLTLDDLSAGDEAAHNAGKGAIMLRNVAQQGGGQFEWVFRGVDQRPFYGEVSLSRIPGNNGEHAQLVIRDITTHVLALQQMRHDASHDPLTGLANRREFERRLAIAQATSPRDGELQHMVCLLDLDKFKLVNDSAGHAAGDALLKQVAGVMKSRVRASDLLARFGGDEFGLLLESCSTEHAVIIALNLVQAVEELRFQHGDRVFSVGVSVGMAVLAPGPASLESVLATADAACYAAKSEGSRLKLANSPHNNEPGA
jgi:diguanylate cyclase (GGDEF)-like protein